MSFVQSNISNVIVVLADVDLDISWSSSAQAGTVYQVYVDRRLNWAGRASRCRVPVPAAAEGRNAWVEVGTVASNEATIDFSSQLNSPGQSGEFAQLTWMGGTYLDPTGNDDVVGFQIYASPAAGGQISWTAPIDTVAAYPGGWISDGFGLGGFGQGGFGRASTSYQWTSTPLSSGTWQFAVAPFDHAGNAQLNVSPIAITITRAPRPPAAPSQGSRLTYSISGPTSRQVSLTWLASPS